MYLRFRCSAEVVRINDVFWGRARELCVLKQLMRSFKQQCFLRVFVFLVHAPIIRTCASSKKCWKMLTFQSFSVEKHALTPGMALALPHKVQNDNSALITAVFVSTLQSVFPYRVWTFFLAHKCQPIFFILPGWFQFACVNVLHEQAGGKIF